MSTLAWTARAGQRCGWMEKTWKGQQRPKDRANARARRLRRTRWARERAQSGATV